MDDLGFPMTPDRLSGLYGLCVQWSEVYETMMGTCGPYNLDGSARTIVEVRMCCDQSSSNNMLEGNACVVRVDAAM